MDCRSECKIGEPSSNSIRVSYIHLRTNSLEQVRKSPLAKYGLIAVQAMIGNNCRYGDLIEITYLPESDGLSLIYIV